MLYEKNHQYNLTELNRSGILLAQNPAKLALNAPVCCRRFFSINLQ